MKDVLEGFNGSIFAYGQTSSGKTHTLLGTREQPGVIILTVQELLTTMASQSSVKDYMMSVSYVEVYNENLVDLLDMSVDAGASKAGSGGLRIFEDKTFGPFVRGITVAPISKPEQVVDFLFSGERRRSYAFTEMNSRSSRSHTVFQIMVESRVAIDGGREADAPLRWLGDRACAAAAAEREALAAAPCVSALPPAEQFAGWEALFEGV